MMKKIIFLFFLLSITIGILQAQEVYIQMGKNYTKYLFSAETNELPTFTADVGNSYTLGFSTLKSNDSPFFLDFGLSINEYNAKGYYGLENLEYKTNYAGLFTALNCRIIYSKQNCLAISAGISTQSIVQGNQKINNSNDNLMKQEEFKGLVLGPKLGLKYTYAINNDINLLVDYGYSKHWNLTYSGTQKLSINNHGIHFGFSINMY